jgi:hypothetical protein
MSFFAMYPPIFREKKQLPLNVTSLKSWSSFAPARGAPPRGHALDDDRTLHRRSRASEDHPLGQGPGHPRVREQADQRSAAPGQQHYDGTGRAVAVWRAHRFSDLYARPGSVRVYKTAADRTMEVMVASGRKRSACAQVRRGGR